MTSREGPRGDEDSRPLSVSGEGVVGAKTLYPVNDRRPCYFNFNLVNFKLYIFWNKTYRINIIIKKIAPAFYSTEISLVHVMKVKKVMRLS